MSELYRLAGETVKSSISYRDFIVNIIKHLARTTFWANEGMIEPLLSELKKKIVHCDELDDIKLEIVTGENNPYKEHWANIILGALSGYGKIDVAADRVIEALELSASKSLKISLDDLDLTIRSYLRGGHALNLGGDARLESLRVTCDSITQLGLNTVDLIDLYMTEGQYAAQEAIQERKQPDFQEENGAYYMENHLTTWVEEVQIKNPTNWELDLMVSVLEELGNLLNYEPIDQSALEADDND